jgi:CheY-like chemotaxis protein
MEAAMKILIADDDPNKMRQLKSFVAQEFVDAEILECNSFNSALRCAMLDEPTVILLDMTMPTFDVGGKETGGYERRYAGFEVLRRLKRRRKARRVIIVRPNDVRSAKRTVSNAVSGKLYRDRLLSSFRCSMA